MRHPVKNVCIGWSQFICAYQEVQRVQRPLFFDIRPEPTEIRPQESSGFKLTARDKSKICIFVVAVAKVDLPKVEEDLEGSRIQCIRLFEFQLRSLVLLLGGQKDPKRKM